MHKARNKHGPDTEVGIRIGWPRGPAIITGEPPPEWDIGSRRSEVRGRLSRNREAIPIAIGTREVSRMSEVGSRMSEVRGRLSRDREAIPIAIGTREVRGQMSEARGRKSEDGSRRLVGLIPPLVTERSRSALPQKVRLWHPCAFISQRRTDESPSCFVNDKNIKHIDSKARNDLPATERLKHRDFKDNCCLKATTMPCCVDKKSFRPEYFEEMTRRQGEMETRGVDVRWLNGADQEMTRGHGEMETRGADVRWLRWLVSAVEPAETIRVKECKAEWLEWGLEIRN